MRHPRAIANEILSVPRYKRVHMLRLTEPHVDSGQFMNWVRRGYFDPNHQFAAGTKEDLTAVADAQGKNEAWSAGDARRLYTGGDVIKLDTLSATSQAGIPLAMAKAVISGALYAAHDLILSRHCEPGFVPEGG